MPGIKEVEFSITHNRGCFGACNFCSIAFHQGRYVTSRSKKSAPAITDEYPGINTPTDLYDALSHIWCADTCAPRMRDRWTKDNMPNFVIFVSASALSLVLPNALSKPNWALLC